MQEEKKKKQLLLSEETEKTEVEKFEELDEGQIKDELKGKIIEDYAYQFKQGSRTITGLSYAGIMAAVRKQGNIKILSIDIREDAEKIVAEATGKDLAANVEIKGIASQPRVYKSGQPDDFALVKATVKAQRNVLRRLVNEPVAKAILEMALERMKKHREDAKAFM